MSHLNESRVAVMGLDTDWGGMRDEGGPYTREGVPEIEGQPTAGYRRYSGRVERETAYNNIQKFKNRGRNLGEEIRRELEQEKQKKKNLEQRLSAIIGIAGIGASLFFLGSSVTGNAIGSLSISAGSWIGLVLLAIGLISEFFWLKNRKK